MLSVDMLGVDTGAELATAHCREVAGAVPARMVGLMTTRCEINEYGVFFCSEHIDVVPASQGSRRYAQNKKRRRIR